MSHEHDERLPRGEQGVQGAQGIPGQRGERGMQGLRGLPTATRRAIVFLFLLAAFLGVFNAFWNSHNVNRAAAAQQAEQRQYEAAQRHAAAAAKAAQLKASVPVCKALLRLSQVQGSHGTSTATYGVHLEAALKAVYLTTGCAQVLALTGNSAPPHH